MEVMEGLETYLPHSTSTMWPKFIRFICFSPSSDVQRGKATGFRNRNPGTTSARRSPSASRNTETHRVLRGFPNYHQHNTTRDSDQNDLQWSQSEIDERKQNYYRSRWIMNLCVDPQILKKGSRHLSSSGLEAVRWRSLERGPFPSVREKSYGETGILFRFCPPLISMPYCFVQGTSGAFGRETKTSFTSIRSHWVPICLH
jgi:hypothetical protein